MTNWLISADETKYDPKNYFDNYGYVDWQAHKIKYDVGDVVYIYSKLPIGRVRYKTIVEETNITFPGNDENYVRLSLIKQVNIEELSLDSLRKIGLKTIPRGPKKLDDALVNFFEKYFKGEIMWMVRAGDKGVLYDEFKKRDIIAIGWDIGDVAGLSKDEIAALLREKYKNNPEKTKQGIAKNAGTIIRFRDELEKGDYVISASPLSEKYLLGEITSDYYFSNELIEDKVDAGCKYDNLRKVRWLCEIHSDKLSECVISFLGSGTTLFAVNEVARDEILNFYLHDYKWGEETRNVIYFGAPGTGKSFNLNVDKDELIFCKSDYERVTFHPDYSYANFVGTYKPRPIINEEGKRDITYVYVPGPFMRTLVKAFKNPHRPFLLIIEEINRANVAAVFGDVFQLLDRDENKESKYDIETSEDIRDYLEYELKESINNDEDLKRYLISILNKDFSRIKIPSNMFIWATMNSADQGVFPMDTAFKRRWDFKYFGIDDDQKRIKHIKFNFNDQEISWNNLRKAINKDLLSYKINEDKLIGPFYAFNEYLDEKEFSKLTDEEKENLKKIFKNKILMYLFEDAARAHRNVLFEGAKDHEEDNLIYSEICNKFDSDGIKIFNNDIQKYYDLLNKEGKPSDSEEKE